MLELKRIKVLDRADVPGNYDDFDPKTLEQHPIVLRRGKVRYRLGEIYRAYKGTDGIFADIILQGNFKVFLNEVEDEIRIWSVEFVPE